ncbi:hypothetical protein DFH11DRAFT_1830571 [Phellopilus nigrolimitatus]|nr:hypothetical protein DFH11DRAFT_1830571 [Phellopilus nigrolimitatus]
MSGSARLSPATAHGTQVPLARFALPSSRMHRPSLPARPSPPVRHHMPPQPALQCVCGVDDDEAPVSVFAGLSVDCEAASDWPRDCASVGDDDGGEREGAEYFRRLSFVGKDVYSVVAAERLPIMSVRSAVASFPSGAARERGVRVHLTSRKPTAGVEMDDVSTAQHKKRLLPPTWVWMTVAEAVEDELEVAGVFVVKTCHTFSALEVQLPPPKALRTCASSSFINSPMLFHSDSFYLTFSAFDDNGPGKRQVLDRSVPLLHENIHMYWGEVVAAEHSPEHMREDAAGVLPRPSQQPGKKLGWARIMVHSQGDAARGLEPVFEVAFETAVMIQMRDLTFGATRMYYRTWKRCLEGRKDALTMLMNLIWIPGGIPLCADLLRSGMVQCAGRWFVKFLPFEGRLDWLNNGLSEIAEGVVHGHGGGLCIQHHVFVYAECDNTNPQ